MEIKLQNNNVATKLNFIEEEFEVPVLGRDEIGKKGSESLSDDVERRGTISN